MTVIQIRPHHIFDLLVTDSIDDRACTVLIPHKTNYSGGIVALETLLLISLLKSNRPDIVFEFGTYMGATTALLCMNTGAYAKVVSIDLPPRDNHSVANIVTPTAGNKGVLKEDNDVDAALINHSTAIGAYYIDHTSCDDLKKLVRIYGDSTVMPLSDYYGVVDFVWVDGGHDYDVVKSDTENALRMLNKNNKKSTLVWHDYGNKSHPGVTRYIDELAQMHKIYCIGNTYMALCMPYSDGDIMVG